MAVPSDNQQLRGQQAGEVSSHTAPGAVAFSSIKPNYKPIPSPHLQVQALSRSQLRASLHGSRLAVAQSGQRSESPELGTPTMQYDLSQGNLHTIS